MRILKNYQQNEPAATTTEELLSCDFGLMLKFFILPGLLFFHVRQVLGLVALSEPPHASLLAGVGAYGHQGTSRRLLTGGRFLKFLEALPEIFVW